MERLTSVKSANRTLIEIARPSWRCLRIRRAVRSAIRSSSRRITSGESVSRPNVSCEPTLRSGTMATTRRTSRPQASHAARRRHADRDPAQGPYVGVPASSPTVWMPSRCSLAAVGRPTPHIASTGSGCRKSATPSAGTSTSPSGLAARDATLATNLVGPMPTEQVICCSSAMTARRTLADRTAGAEHPQRAGHVEEGLVDRRRLDHRAHRANTVDDRLGHLAVAVEVGRTNDRPAGAAAWPGRTDMPDRTPRARASYVDESTTPRANPPTITGLPRRSGRWRSSTDA